MGTLTRTIASLLSVSALGLGSLLVTVPAQGAPPPKAPYDALGDSYAAGAGVPPYEACGRSGSAPAHLIDGRMRISLDDFVACSGAKTTDMAAQLPALDASTKLVTLSIGGNDIGWSQAVGACIVYPEATCAGAVGQSAAAVRNVLPPRLDGVYAAISQRAPNAHVVVTGYPRLFSPEYGDYVTPLGTVTVAEQRIMNEGADLLNSVMAAAAARHGFQFVDVTKRFLGHGVNAPDTWVGGVQSSAPFHPNLAGYVNYASAITAAVNPRDLR